MPINLSSDVDLDGLFLGNNWIAAVFVWDLIDENLQDGQIGVWLWSGELIRNLLQRRHRNMWAISNVAPSTGWVGRKGGL